MQPGAQRLGSDLRVGEMLLVKSSIAGVLTMAEWPGCRVSGLALLFAANQEHMYTGAVCAEWPNGVERQLPLL